MSKKGEKKSKNFNLIDKLMPYRKLFPIFSVAFFLILAGLILVIVSNVLKIDNSLSSNNSGSGQSIAVYGFAYVYQDNTNYRIMALNSLGKDFEIHNGEGPITFNVKHGQLLFINRRGNPTDTSYPTMTYYVDLSDPSYQANLLTQGVNFYDYFDHNEQYLFGRNVDGDNTKGIKRYDFSSQKEKVFEEEVHANGFFISGGKLYYSVSDNSDPAYPQNKYYSLSLDGKTNDIVSQDVYMKVVEDAGYKEEIADPTKCYFLKNEQKVMLDESATHVLYGDKEIFAVTDPSNKVVLTYSSNDDIIAFKEYNPANGVHKNYYYFISSGNSEEVTDEQTTDFKEIIL